jgi:hypothetical protein
MSVDVSEEHIVSIFLVEELAELPSWMQVARNFHASFLLGLFLDQEDGDDMSFRNVSWLSTDHTALYPGR